MLKNPANNSELVARAKTLATKAHSNQKYGDQPYSIHLEAVESVLLEFGVSDENLRAAAWLHDVVEDTAVTLKELEQEFPPEVTKLVQAVTNEPGNNRKERSQKTYLKIKLIPEAIVLKLADRIANGRKSMQTSKDSLYKMYQKEHSAFREALYVQDPTTKLMWQTLDVIFL